MNRSGTQKPATNLDSIDFHILEVLAKRGRATHMEVGEEVGLSASAAYRRIRSLERAHVIRGYQAVVDEEALGMGTTVFIRVTLTRPDAGQLDAFEKAIRRCPNVFSCFMMAGEHDYLIKMCLADIRDFERIHREQISRLPGIARTESTFVLRTVIDRKPVVDREPAGH